MERMKEGREKQRRVDEEKRKERERQDKEVCFSSLFLLFYSFISFSSFFSSFSVSPSFSSCCP